MLIKLATLTILLIYLYWFFIYSYMGKRVPITIWMAKETKDLLKKKFYEAKARNPNIITMEDYILYLLNYLIKEY